MTREASLPYTITPRTVPFEAALAARLVQAIWPESIVTALPRKRIASQMVRVQSAKTINFPAFCKAVQTSPERKKRCMETIVSRWTKAASSKMKVKADCHASSCMCGITFPLTVEGEVQGLVDLQSVRIESDTSSQGKPHVTLASKTHTQRMKLDSLFRLLPLLTQDDYQHLSVLLNDLLAHAQLETETSSPTRTDENLGPMAGRSATMQAVFDSIQAIAAMDQPVLLTGASGTGKTLAAELIHRSGSAPSTPWYTLDCRMLHRTKAANELFGYKRSTGTLRAGWLQFMRGGTLVLQHLDAIPLPLQTMLAKAITKQSFTMMDTDNILPLQCRILATTTQDLKAQVSYNEFSDELFQAVATQSIALPPLHERKEDILLIVRELLHRQGKSVGLLPAERIRTWSIWAARQEWPGNVMALRTAMDAWLASGLNVPGKWSFWESGKDAKTGIDMKFKLATLEREMLRRSLAETGDDLAETGRQLKLSVAEVRIKIRNYDIRTQHDA